MKSVAAVLLGILDDKIVLTKRAASLRSFTGHICLPGGGFDIVSDTSVIDTAFREFREELMFDGEIQELFCMLPECSVVSSQAVYPVVAKLNGQINGVNFAEVDKLLYLPTSKLHYELFQINPDYPTIKHNKRFELDGEIVWGLTAHILYKFVDIYREFR